MAKKKTEQTVEPILLDCGKAIKGKVFKGTTFEMTKTTKGILYHCYGGYNIFVSSSNVSLYMTLDDLIENNEKYSSLVGEDKENFELNLSVIMYILNIPTFSFTSSEFTFDIATRTIQFLNQSLEGAMNMELQEETVEEDAKFKDAMMAIEDMKKNV